MFKNGSVTSASIKNKTIHHQLDVSSFNILDTHPAVIFIAPEKGAGNTMSVIASAYYLAQNFAAKTVIVDGNPFNPQLNSLFNISGFNSGFNSKSPGFFDVLADDSISYEKVIYSTDAPFDIVPAGASLAGSVSLAGSDPLNKMNSRRQGSQRFEGFFDSLKQRYDYILFDACPISSSHYFMRYLKCFNGVILVVACEKTRWEVAHHLKEKIVESNGKPIGVILNRRKYYIPSRIYKHIA